MVQYRKSKKIGPFRFTLSQRGISASVGKGPLRISRGADDKYRRTLRAPGIGLYDTKVIGASAGKRVGQQQSLDGAALVQNVAILIGGGIIGLLLVFGLAFACSSTASKDRKYRTPPTTVVTTVVTVTPRPSYTYTPRPATEVPAPSDMPWLSPPPPKPPTPKAPSQPWVAP